MSLAKYKCTLLLFIIIIIKYNDHAGFKATKIDDTKVAYISKYCVIHNIIKQSKISKIMNSKLYP